MDAPTVTLLPLHTPQLEDGTPVLRGGGGRRIRYTIQPLDEPSQASLASTAEPATSLTGAPVGNEELVVPAPKNCVCPVCSRLFFDPVAAACKHAVCRACFDAAEKDGVPCCPVCMKAASALKPQPMLSWLVDSLEVRCPASAEGCTAVVPRGRLAAHLESCAHVRVPCPHAELGCSMRVARADLGAHLRGCPFESCAAFMVSTLRRLEALEADNRSLRAELRAHSASLSWAEASVAHPCADWRALPPGRRVGRAPRRGRERQVRGMQRRATRQAPPRRGTSVHVALTQAAPPRGGRQTDDPRLRVGGRSEQAGDVRRGPGVRLN